MYLTRRLSERQVDIAALIAALIVVQPLSVEAASEEETVSTWLETYYRLAEQRYYAWVSASWNFNVNITEENNQRLVSITPHG